MSQIDALKEKTALLKQIFFVLIGSIVLTIGGILNMYVFHKNKIDIWLWLGVGLIVVLSLWSASLYRRIGRHIRKMEDV